MSKAFASKKKKSISSRLKTVSKKKQLNVQITRPNILEMVNSPTQEERDEKLETFHKKVMKKTTLPSISDLLSSQPLNSIQKPRLGAKKYPQNGDVFVKNDSNSTLIDNERFDKPASSPLDSNRKKLEDRSISRMFSDGLSDQENFGQELSNFGDLDEFETDSLPSAINRDSKKSEDILAGENKRKKEGRVLKNLGKNGSRLFPEALSLRANFQSNEELGQTGGEDSLERNKEFNSCSQKIMKNLSGLASLLNNSTDESPQPKIQRFSLNAEPFIVGDVKAESSAVYGNYAGNEDRSFLNIFEQKSSIHETIYDEDCEGCAATINIALSECNLDHSINSEDSSGRSIRSIDKRAAWYMNEDNLIENGVELTPERNSIPWEKTRMDYERDENLDLSDLILNGVNFINKDSVIGTEEVNNASLNGSQSSDPFVQIFGSTISGRSQISLPRYVPEFSFLPNNRISLESKNEIRPERRHSSFDITQQMYIRERSPFLNRKKTKHATTGAFKLCDSVTKELEQSGPKNCDDNMRRLEDHASYRGKEMETYKDLIKKLKKSNTEKFATFNSTKKCSERRHPFDESISFLNFETNTTNDLRQKDENAATRVGAVENAPSEHQLIPMDQLSCASFDSSIFSNDNVTDRSSLNRFWKVSRHVQSFVTEWLDKNDEMNSAIPEMFVDKEKLLLKRRRLDVDSEKTDATIDIDPKMMLSNYSCEYDRADMIERFKPE